MPGEFASVPYKGQWHSVNPSQWNYLQVREGEITLKFKDLVEEDNSLRSIINLFETKYVEDKRIVLQKEFQILENNQTDLVNLKNSTNFQFDKLDQINQKKDCETKIVIFITDRNGNQRTIKYDDLNNIVLLGKIYSKECGLDLDFKMVPNFIALPFVLIYMLLGIIFSILNFYPYGKVIASNQMEEMFNLNENAFLLNLLVDVSQISIFIEMEIGLYQEYFEFFSIVEMFLLIVFLTKIRFIMYVLEYRLDTIPPNSFRYRQAQYVFYFKGIFLIFIGFLFSLKLVYYYQIYYILFLYGFIQIYHNFYFVVKKNCFNWKIHPFFLLSQVFQPVAFRLSIFNSIFRLRQDHQFSILLLGILSFQLFVMYLQKFLGPWFFLPKSWNPNYYNYFKKTRQAQIDFDQKCPICFCSLRGSAQDLKLEEPLIGNQIMVTPCEHIFHSICLKNWMDQKLRCPCCRQPIPPYI